MRALTSSGGVEKPGRVFALDGLGSGSLSLGLGAAFRGRCRWAWLRLDSVGGGVGILRYLVTVVGDSLRRLFALDGLGLGSLGLGLGTADFLGRRCWGRLGLDGVGGVDVGVLALVFVVVGKAGLLRLALGTLSGW